MTGPHLDLVYIIASKVIGTASRLQVVLQPKSIPTISGSCNDGALLWLSKSLTPPADELAFQSLHCDPQSPDLVPPISKKTDFIDPGEF